MKKSISLGLVLAIALVSVAVAAPDDLPGPAWYTGQTIQNVGTAGAIVVVTAYDATTEYTLDLATDTDKLAAGASSTFMTNDTRFVPLIPDGFQGAAVVSSDQAIKAIVNVTNVENAGAGLGVAGGWAAAQYQGVDGSAVDTTVVFPLVKNNFGNKTTTFYIQNAGTGAADITAVYQMRTSPTDPVVVEYTQQLTIPDTGQMVVLNPSAAKTAGNVAMPASRIGALTVTANKNIAGVVLEHRATESPATLLQATRGFTPADYDDVLFVPVMKNKFGDRSTGLQVMNVSGAPVDINVEYFPTLGTCTDSPGAQKLNLADGESWTFLEVGIAPGCLASAKVTATGNVVGVINESFFYGSHVQASTTYSAYPEKSATTKLAGPVFKEVFGPKGTGLSVQNVSGGLATITAQFTVDRSQAGTPQGSVYEATFTLEAGEALTLLDVNTLAGLTWGATGKLPKKNLCAVVITANQNIVALANESPWPPGAPSLQDKNNYEAFNLVP